MQSNYSTLERFLKYVTFDTQSAEGVETVPSTPGQLELAQFLTRELEALGLRDVQCTEHAYVTATLPGNTKKKVPAIGFIAHLDTATELSGKAVKPRVVERYDGGDIVLNKEENIILSPKDFPFMKKNIGMDLVVAGGTTLLGADNKAGVAEIMGAVEYLLAHPEVERGDMKIAFTPDEEIGHMAALLDIEAFGADFAYTVDGGPVGEYSFENFNAAAATLEIQGRAVHPGEAKGLMRNAVMMGVEFCNLLPPAETPATTEGHEGFFHCLGFDGETERATLRFLIRDHDARTFETRKAFLRRAVKWMQDKYGEERFTLTIRDQYRNMRDKLKGRMDIVETLTEAMRELGIAPHNAPMRGGTDGAALSWRGLITPNFFAGGCNYHGRYEFIPVQAMEQATALIVKILELYAKKAE